MNKYEYKWIEIKPTTRAKETEVLNEAGNDGWKLVDMMMNTFIDDEGWTGYRTRFLLERRLSFVAQIRHTIDRLKLEIIAISMSKKVH